jgi:hypothetical protein
VIELNNNCPYLGTPILAGSAVVLCDKGKRAELRRDACRSVRGIKIIDLSPKGLETVVCSNTPCSLKSNF